ncbi:hypothetical protein BTI679_58840 (plasmid) [Bacillus wiedmannii]|nr:hypothetical protein [Bacillus wiedmannii]UOB98485.1 hypothetical protein BTI679_58840 [Bacillus wiedmannii]
MYWSYAIPDTDKVGRIPNPFNISLLANTVERANKYREGDPYAFDKTVNAAVKVPWTNYLTTGCQVYGKL